ncbi:GNAT family N-acetyltransferase [Microlunatus elymi]|uniref:GNAT family N-acetyltransferase n=1 Tax=Microlunatus elymi TaxID=2596828 RepID=A0A516Q491_9ACTN|nr:GNAT family N-acetyltransferase [Microlunatus elymi]QDP98263.1 GNAT family N-acetyltransferase [Microlunatus elymi]
MQTDPASSGYDKAALLRAYDEQLRTDAETVGALDVTRLGPLRLATMPSGRGFVSYRDLAGADEATIRDWVGQVVDHYRERAEIAKVEWKTRGHDHAPGLHQALVDHGFVAQEPESIMVGPAAALIGVVPLPDGVTLRRLSTEPDVRVMMAMAESVFGDPPDEQRASDIADGVLRRLDRGDAVELWVAEHDGTMISAGRLEPVAGTDFAGIWGGATLPQWRGRGIYRALTAERARSALRLGKTLIHSDSTEYSRPILERSGLVKVSTTTPYEWRRG